MALPRPKVKYIISKQPKYISFNPQIMGGNPTIAGTRVPLERVMFLLTENFPMEYLAEELQIREELMKKALLEYVTLLKSSGNDKAPQEI